MSLHTKTDELRINACENYPELNAALIEMAKCLPEPMILELKADPTSERGCVFYKTTAEFMPVRISYDVDAKPIDELLNQILLTHNIYSPDQSQNEDESVFSELPLYGELKDILSQGQEYDHFNQLLQTLNERGLEQLSSHMYLHHPKDIGGKYEGVIMTDPGPGLQDMRSFRAGRFQVCKYQLL